MAAGGDKTIAFDPPGALGLYDAAAILVVRFDESDDDAFPQDEGRVLDDLDPALTGGALAMPTVVSGAVGMARDFQPVLSTGLGARDRESGATLLTRDMTIQAIVFWDGTLQAASGQGGNIISRGLGTSSAERLCFALELAVVDAASNTASLRWVWQDVGGTIHVQAGATVTLPRGYTMLTATRRWISPTSVELRYYVGDILVGTVASADGGIGGGTTGAIQIGTRHQGSDGHFFAGKIDEVMLVGRVLCLEEVEATWLRITRYQPLGQQLILEMHDDGFPQPQDPGSDVQRELRFIGQALGLAAASIEEMRSNFLPQRAYGQVLDDWETLCRLVPKPALSTEERRARVLSRLRQRRGSSRDGVIDAISDLIDADVDDLHFVTFSDTIFEDFATSPGPDPVRWFMQPDSSSWSIVSGAARCLPPGASGDFTFDGRVAERWHRMTMPLAGGGPDAHIVAKTVFSTPHPGGEAGVFFADAGLRNYILAGLRDDGGTFKLVTELFLSGVSQGVVVRNTFGANPAALWLHLYQVRAAPGVWRIAWSTTSGIAGFADSADIAFSPAVNQGGPYLRSFGGTVTTPIASFDEIVLRDGNGHGPFQAYVFLDSTALGAAPDAAGIRTVLSGLKHAFVQIGFTETPVLVAGDDKSLIGITPTGGYMGIP